MDDLSWFNPGALKGLEDEILEIFSTAEEVDESRRAAIAEAVTERARQIERLRLDRRPSITAALASYERMDDEASREGEHSISENEHER